MHRNIGRLLCLLAALAASPAALAADATVHGVQLPAWVERGGRVFPLRPGTTLQAGDVLHTGPRGRIQLDLPEGSAAKLGADATLALPAMRMMRDAGSELWDSTLHLLKGAFRFTTRAAGASMRRNVRVQVGVVTLGVRGTDFWVRADEAGDEFMLMEGRVSVEMAGHATMMMDEPMDAMKFMRDGRMESMEMRAMAPDLMHAKMDSMLAMTEMRHGEGMLMMGMPVTWDVVVMSLRSQGTAERVAERFAKAGYPAEIELAELAAGTFHRVAIKGFASVDDARRFASDVEGRFGATGAWVKRH
jgi:hypothetical protein